MVDLVQAKDFLIQIILEAEEYYLQFRPEKIQEKENFDLVTNQDGEIEKYLGERIRNRYPDSIVIGEEMSPEGSLGKGICWTLDPIDGTVNYANGMPYYGIQAAMLENGIPLISVIRIPSFHETFWAIKGRGAYCNYNKIQVKKEIRLNNAIISHGDFDHKDKNHRDLQIKSIQILSDKVAKIRIVGASSVDYATIACGRTQGHIAYMTTPWDICPGLLLCQEAGAVITNIEGGPYSFADDGLIVAANEEISDLLRFSILP